MCLVFGVRPTLTVKQTKGSEMTEPNAKQQRKNVENGMPRMHYSAWAEGVCYCGPCVGRRHPDDRIQVISSDPRAKEMTLRVIGKWADDQR